MPIVTANNTKVAWAVSGAAAVKSAIANVTANISQTSIDVTPVDGTYKSFTSGLIEGTADIELFYLETDHGVLAPGQTLDAFEVALDANTKVGGKAIIEQYRFSAAPNGVVMATMTIRWCNGAITFA